MQDPPDETPDEAPDQTSGEEGIQPGLLVASPQMADPFFARTVVLLCRHEEGGAMGMVINRSADLELSSVLEDLDVDLAVDSDRMVLWGGPVEPARGTLVLRTALSEGTEDTIEITGDIHISGSLEVLTHLAGLKDDDWILTLGYAGWGPGQLDREIEEGSWIVLPMDPAAIFDLPLDDRYDRCIASLGVDAAMIFMTPVDE
jgi:putative transcriptional regulator